MIAVGNVSHIHQLADCFGCSIETLPCSHLGLLLGAKYKVISTWNLIIEKVDRQLAWWKAQYLSKVGKLTLLKSVLSNIPLYLMSLFVVPKLVMQITEKCLGRFLQGSSDLKSQSIGK